MRADLGLLLNERDPMPSSAASCFRRMAAERPAGLPPMTTTLCSTPSRSLVRSITTLSQLVAAFVGLRRRKFLVGCRANPCNDAAGYV
jgi:hypothetical protein